MGFRFIHSADWHLDRPFKGLSHLPASIQECIQESTFHAMEGIVQTAIREKVDFIMIAGDLFDQNHRSLKAQIRVKEAFNRLKKADIPVYLCHGNHDPLNNPSVHIDFPDNVHVFGSDMTVFTYTSKSGEKANLYGFSYPERHLTQDMTPFYSKKENGAALHIGVLHGSVKGNHEHDQYAPFATESLIDKDYDYWALGHIHKSMALKQRPMIRYSGNIQGLSMKETGEKGVFLVDWSEGLTKDTFIPTGGILWLEETIDVTEINTIHELVKKLMDLKDTLRNRGKSVFVRVRLTGSGLLYEKLQETNLVEEVLEALRDGEDDVDTFIWTVALLNQMAPEWDRTSLLKQPSFIGNVLRYSEENEDLLERTCEPLIRHTRIKKFLEPLSSEDQADIVKEAERYLVHHLHSLQYEGWESNEN